MRILHINDTGFHVGGAETNVFSIMKLFNDKGHEQHLFAFRGGGKPDDEVFVFNDEGGVGGSSVLRYSFGLVEPGLYFDRRIFNVVRKHVDEVNPDVVHLHNNVLHANSVLLALLKSKKPVIQSAHDYGLICPTAWCVRKDGSSCEKGYGLRCLTGGCVWPKKFLREYVPQKISWRLMKKTVKKFICPSRLIEEKINAKGLSNTTHVPYFVFPELFEKNPKKIREGFILFVGVLFPQKGLKHLINAITYVLEEKPNAVLHVVGEGPEKENSIKMAAELGLSEKVVFHGRLSRSELVGLYAKASVVAVPSVWLEQSGIVGLEAMASARPVVGSDIGGIPEWLSDGETGLLCRPRDEKDLAEKIVDVLADKKKAASMGEAGLKTVLNKYSAKAVYPRLLEVYEDAAK